MNDLSYKQLYSMWAQPRSVVKYEGLTQGVSVCRSEAPAPYDSAQGVSVNQPISSLQNIGLFGVQIRFTLDAAWGALTALQMLERLGVELDTSVDPVKQVVRLINQRAAQLPLPDGCAVIPTLDTHRVIWADPLTALTIFSKCTDTVWLRSKTPSLIVASRMTAVSLLIPPSFNSRLPE